MADSINMNISEGVLGWECFDTGHCKYLAMNGAWVDNPIHTDEVCTSFVSREQIERLLDEQREAEDEDF